MGPPPTQGQVSSVLMDFLLQEMSLLFASPSSPLTHVDHHPTLKEQHSKEQQQDLQDQHQVVMMDMGVHVGRSLVERTLVDKQARVHEPLDKVKLICKEFWIFVFGKPIDNLKTNHRVTFSSQWHLHWYR